MKRITLYYLLLFMICNTSQGQQKSMSGNPIFKGWYADPEAIIWNNEYWVFPTFSAPFEKQVFFDAFSSKDLIHWKKHSNIIDTISVRWAHQAMWAPSVVKKGNNYFFFFGANNVHENKVGGIGIGISNKPMGPYKDYIGKPLIDEIVNYAQPIDQFVFQDKDGKYYLYYGGWQHCNVCKLSSDFKRLLPFNDGTYYKEITPEGYVEGPFLFIKNGKYYFMWSEGDWTKSNYQVAYSISNNPFGPFKRVGVILKSNPMVGKGAGHHSIIHEPISDKYYIVYHKRPLTEKDQNSREVCIDEMTFDENGYINPIKITNEGIKANFLKKKPCVIDLKRQIKFAEKKIDLELAKNKSELKNPVTVKKDNTTLYCKYTDWRSGFFPGSLWFMYELTGNEKYFQWANKYTESINQAKYITDNHDVGFIINCSFGNGYRLTDNKEYENVIVTAAKSLITRFRKNPGIIQSWDEKSSWILSKGWNCPVIIDNMMNLELLFKATEISRDSTYYNIAVLHADRTLKEHFRKNGSCYHVIDYDKHNGKVIHRKTFQGYNDNSVWSRGQAWAIYGFEMCFEKTGNSKYLDQAIKTFNFLINHKNMPNDLIPYWDMDDPLIPNTYRDVSSAACIAVALYKMYILNVDNAIVYKRYADRIVKALSSSKYQSKVNAKNNFILMHSVTNKPGNEGVDVPLNYADYYYLEALTLLKRIENM